MNEFGKRLTLCLTLRGKRPIDLALNTGVNKGNISCYISGKYPQPTLKVVRKFAEYLDVDVAYLMGLTNDMRCYSVKPLNSLSDDPEVDMKRALINEAKEILTSQSLDNLQTMLNVLRTLKK